MKKIALAFILKGTEEPSQLVEMLSSAAPYVDAIYATATWNKHGQAADVARSFGAEVSFYKWDKNFANARNYNFKQVPKDYDYILWLDSDDILRGGHLIRGHIESNLDRYFMEYRYQIDEKTGDVLITHPRERIVKNGVFEWKGALHEVLIQKRIVNQDYLKDVFVEHHPTQANIDEGEKRNLEILEKQFKDEGDSHDPRTLYYLGRAYFDANKLPKATKMFWDYLTGDNPSGWDEERAMAYNYLGIIYTMTNDFKDAKACFHMAMDEWPAVPTWYINLGLVYGKEKDWDKALYWTQKGLATPWPKTAMVLNPRDDKVHALETIYFACIEKRQLKEAFAAADKLCQLFPGDKFMLKRKEAMYNLMRWTDMSRNVLELVEELEALDEKYKARALLNNLPSTIGDNAYIEQVKQQYTTGHKWPEKSIVFYCGKALEEWDDTSLEKGIGGSETAVIQLARHWAQSGWNVTILGLPSSEHTDKYGVEWKMYWKFNPNDEFDVFISWRNPTVFNNPIKARISAIDCHDVLEAGEFTKERLDRIDKVFIKSNFQKSFAPHIPDNKFVIIPNGYGKEFVPKKPIKRDPFRLVWSSSYDRGLEELLKWGWPIIKKAIPQAELHCYYGWNIFDHFFSHHPERQQWKAKMLELMKAEGVIDHGRIPQGDLLVEKARSQITYYPTTFHEIDCIAVRESALVGSVPVTTDYAVFAEKDYVLKTKGNPYDKRTQEKIAELVVRLLKHPEELEKERARIKSLVENENWEAIAKRWSEVLK